MIQDPPQLSGSYLVVETTNRCSLRCLHCSVSEKGHAHHVQVGFLDPQIILDLFEDLERAGARFDTLILFWLGEPLIHPEFTLVYQSALRAAVRSGTFGKIELHTNATHLTPSVTRVALNDAPVPQVWHFSLDAASRGTYLEIKGRDLFEPVENNVARMVAERGRLGSLWPRLVFQFIVSHRNEAEVSSFRRRWERSCQRAQLPVITAAQNVPHGEEAVVFFRQLDCPTAEEQSFENGIFREAMEREGLTLAREEKSVPQVEAENDAACSAYWKSPVVGWNGDVTTCTRDNLLLNRLGNLRETPFTQLWWGEEMRQRRSAVREGCYPEGSLCRSCFIPKSSNYTDIEPEEIERHQRWEEGRLQ